MDFGNKNWNNISNKGTYIYSFLPEVKRMIKWMYFLFQSFRIRTPPSTEKSAPWKQNTLELDPKSDSSEQNDVLVNYSVMLFKLPSLFEPLFSLKEQLICFASVWFVFLFPFLCFGRICLQSLTIKPKILEQSAWAYSRFGLHIWHIRLFSEYLWCYKTLFIGTENCCL